jgi:hypothetical protein
MAVTPTRRNCFGGTVDEFIQSANSEFGEGLLGETKFALDAKWMLDAENKIIHPTLSLKITSATAHWAGPGFRDGKPAPRPDALNRDAIARVEALNTSHEQKHIDGFQRIFNNRKREFERKLIGQTEEEAAQTVAEMTDALNAACEELHETEGLISVSLQGSRFSIQVQPRGPGGCD